MHGQGNYPPPVGQGSYASIPSFHQRLQAPPPPPPPQGSLPPQMTIVQSGPPPVPPHAGQSWHPLFQSAPPGPSSQRGPFPPVSSSGVNAQHYFSPLPPPPPTLRPPSPLPPQSLQVYGSSQLHPQPQLMQTAHFIPPAPPALTLVQPPHALQGQTVYGGQVRQQTASSSGFHASFHAGTILPSSSQAQNMPATLPPPPPPPPSLPSCPPGSPSPPSLPSAVSNEIGPSVDQGSGLGELASDSVAAVLASSPTGDYVSESDGYGKWEGENRSHVDSKIVKSLILNLPSPPPKPTDAKVLRNIELLCQSIAENGIQYEDMIQQREAGNPEFKFMFSDETRNENSIAHEYFLWMRKKCQLGLEADEKLGRSDSIVRQKETSPSDCKSCIPYSPVDSDMDMEDDITHPEAELLTSTFIHQGHGLVAESNEAERNHLSNSSEEHNIDMDAMDENFVHSGSSGLRERQGSDASSNPDYTIVKKLFTKADESARNFLTEARSPLDSTVCSLSSPHGDLVRQNATTALAESRSEKLTGQLVKETSPFRLLQDYASDGSLDDEAHLEDIIPVTVDQSVDTESSTLDAGVMDAGPKSMLESHKEREQLGESSINKKIVTSETKIASTSEKNKDFVQGARSNQETVTHVSRHGELQEENVQRDSRRDATSDRKEDTQNMSALPKVDKFGRLVREGGSESDSEGSPRYSRRYHKKDRSRSTSRSPHDRNRRRSPWKRKIKRGRSRSLSPKGHRSKSRSPPHWHGGEFGGNKTRREKGVAGECFDFRRGRCYRGASCRYMHHVEKSDRSRPYRSKLQMQDVSFSPRTSDVHEKIEISEKKLFNRNDGFQELHTSKDRPYFQETKVLEESAGCLPQEGDHFVMAAHPNPDAESEKLLSVAAHTVPSIKEHLEPEKPEKHSTPVVQNVNVQDDEMCISTASESLPNYTPISAPIQNPIDKPLNMDSSNNLTSGFSLVNIPFLSESSPSQSLVPQESVPPVSASDHSHVRAPPFSSPVQDTHSLHTQQMPRAPNLVSPSPNHPSIDSFSTNQASVSYGLAQYPPPPIPFWNSLPPPPAQIPPPPPLLGINVTGGLVHGQYSSHSVPVQDPSLPPAVEFSTQTSGRPCATDFFKAGLHQTYPSAQELSQPSHPWDGLHPKPIPVNQLMSQPRGGHEIVGRERFSAQALPDLYPSSSISQENLLSRGLPFSKEPLFSGVHALPRGSAAPADGVSSRLGEDGKAGTTLSRYTSDLLDRNQPFCFADFGSSRIVNHFNPYASTFEKPLSSKFSSNLATHEMDRQYGSKYGASFGLNHLPLNGSGVPIVGSKNFISPQNSAQAVQGILPRPGGDQYDPLYDSLEPSSNSVRKSDHGQNRETTDESDFRFRFSGSSKPLDLDANSKKVGDGAVELPDSLENEEYGETADAEVVAVENESSSNLNDGAGNTGAEEVEIDQVKAPGKKKKGKDSRSMRLFKIALANFVKEVLKPSWRQGNMSKEAFKTIVKKTVDKVAGAMKSHHIPKSQAKINHFIDSSQRKLTKLVMGYVEKYVKV